MEQASANQHIQMGSQQKTEQITYSEPPYRSILYWLTAMLIRLDSLMQIHKPARSIIIF